MTEDDEGPPIVANILFFYNTKDGVTPRAVLREDTDIELEEGDELTRMQDVIDWIKDHQRRSHKDYGQASDQGTMVEQSFEAGYSSAFDKLLQELGESPEPDNEQQVNQQDGS